MLTVKWTVQTPKGSVTRIFEADDVAIAYRNNPLPPTSNDGSDFKVGRYAVGSAILVINPHDASADRALDCGTCYVMNDHGKTVGSYELGDKVMDAGSGFIPFADPIIAEAA